MIVFPPKYQIRLLDMDRAFVGIQAFDFQSNRGGRILCLPIHKVSDIQFRQEI